MKKVFLFLTILLFCNLFVSCSSTSAKKDSVSSMKISEAGDQIAKENIVFTEKRPIISDDKKFVGYQFILKNKIVAKEILNENGDVLYFEGDLPNGLIKQYDINGVLVAENNYNAGKLEGVNKTFYSDGKTVATVKNYKNGILEGKYFEYYENGNKKQESSYKNGLLNGVLKKYSISGTLISSAQYADGKMDGIYKEYFVTGTPKKEIEYYNGLKEGFSKEYFPNGTLKNQYNYSQDNLEGDSQIYYEDGCIYMIEKYKNNKLDGDIKIYSNNNSEFPLYIDTYVNGKKIKRKVFSNQGKLIFQQ